MATIYNHEYNLLPLPNYHNMKLKKKCTDGKLSSDRRGTSEGSATDDGGRDGGGREAGTAAGRAATTSEDAPSEGGEDGAGRRGTP
ncbi:hypothetical protein Syun_028042 [Stephania yunnanensis]|uniref:Uncharacterized protein n=1 Tax=Stephania yunnanensis TaxID=152371 RepID=A0AAP0EGM6_9MAGN